jgi:hypothetical protein
MRLVAVKCKAYRVIASHPWSSNSLTYRPNALRKDSTSGTTMSAVQAEQRVLMSWPEWSAMAPYGSR